jgi:hypothetical protein
MNIATARVEAHEIAKNEDFEFGFQNVIRNTAILDRMLTSANVDYVSGGKARAKGGMKIAIDPLWANGRAIDLPAYQDAESDPITLAAPAVFPRIDIIQVRGQFEDYDIQRRAFWNSELQAAQYHNINTKRRLIADIVIKQGVEGDEHAPEADTGYVKIAELYLEPETTEILPENIKNVTAAYPGGENADWTTEKNITFRIGSDALNGTIIPTGDIVTIDGVDYPALESITTVLKALAARGGGGTGGGCDGSCSGLFIFEIDQSGHLILHFDHAIPYVFEIGQDDHLITRYDGAAAPRFHITDKGRLVWQAYTD